MIRRAHHIDFVVHDLDRAVSRFSKIFGIEPLQRERLEERGVELVRFDVGGIWIALVQPIRSDSPVQSFLDEHGEGFFHIAFQVDDLVSEARRIEAAGIRLTSSTPRRGVEGWKLIDLVMDDTCGVYTQLIEEDAD